MIRANRFFNIDRSEVHECVVFFIRLCGKWHHKIIEFELFLQISRDELGDIEVSLGLWVYKRFDLFHDFFSGHWSITPSQV